MVIKGNARGGAAKLSAHLLRTDTNERAELVELRGVAAHDLEGALLEMEAVASGARSKRHFYHAAINTRADERLTPEQRELAIDRLEDALGLSGQPRAVMLHEKEGREHFHVVWSRIDLEQMTAISDSHNYRRHEEVARDLEREFGHERVQGAHVEREGEARPDRTPTHAEMMQAERTGLSPKEAKAQITALWQSTDSGKAFAAALEDQGWILARGDKRDFVVLDAAGEPHSLARRIEGAKAKDVRERMVDLDPASLPNVAEAKELQAARQLAQEQAPAPEVVTTPAAEPPEPAPLVEVPEVAAVEIEPESSPALDDSVLAFKAHEERERIEAAQPAAPDPEPEPDLAPAALMVVDRAADAAGAVVGKLTDVADKLLDFFVGAPPPRKLSAVEIMTDPEARRQHMAQGSAERARDAALARIAADMEKNRRLSVADIRSLSRADLEGIKATGDAYLLSVVRQREREEERKRRERGREL